MVEKSKALQKQEEREREQFVALRDYLTDDKVSVMLREAIPKHLDGDRFLQLALSTAFENKDLLKCDVKSILRTLMFCAKWELEPTGKGGVWLIPYGETCQGIIDYRAERDLILRDGKIRRIDAEIIYARDEFSYDPNAVDAVRHTVELFEKGEDGLVERDRGEMIGVYARAIYADGSYTQYRVLTKSQVDTYAQRSAAVKKGRSSPWDTDYEAMAKKTVIRRLCNDLPRGKAQQAIAEIEEQPRVVDINDLRPHQPVISVPIGEAPPPPPIIEQARDDQESPTNAEMWEAVLNADQNASNVDALCLSLEWDPGNLTHPQRVAIVKWAETGEEPKS